MRKCIVNFTVADETAMEAISQYCQKADWTIKDILFPFASGGLRWKKDV